MSDQPFSFRWGIHLLDLGDTRVPNFFFDRYHEAGVTRTQFLTILHLARYQYETAGSQCRPSVPTVARQMGYTVRGLQKVLAAMEKRGLLKRRYRASLPTIYDFTGFSYAVLHAELAARNNPPSVIDTQLQFLLDLDGEPQFTPDGEPQFTMMVNPSSPKEEKKEEQTRNDGDDDHSKQEHLIALTDFGVDSTVAQKLANRRTLPHILAWIAHAKRSTNLRDPVGLVVRRLLDDVPAPAPRQQAQDDRYRIELTVCPTCGCTIVIQAICQECGSCRKCCECEDETEESME